MAIKKTVIGITDCSKWENYARWFREVPGVEVIRLSYKDKNFRDIENCDGIVLSGGEDVHPRFYNKPEYLSVLKPDEIKEDRDEFEMNVIKNGLNRKKPILGICRGLQVANVYFGGTLIPDIPSDGKPSH
jgi:putative glutamine amidotransferase